MLTATHPTALKHNPKTELSTNRIKRQQGAIVKSDKYQPHRQKARTS
jgi:hypothetical protein